MQTRRWNPSLTPPHWGWVVLIVVLWWLSGFVGALVVHVAEPASSDEFSEAMFYITWLTFGLALPVPLLGAVTALILYKYPGSVSLWHWQKSRPFWSGFWTLTAALLILLVASEAPTAGTDWERRVHSGGFLYIVLMFRAILVGRLGPSRNR